MMATMTDMIRKYSANLLVACVAVVIAVGCNQEQKADKPVAAAGTTAQGKTTDQPKTAATTPPKTHPTPTAAQHPTPTPVTPVQKTTTETPDKPAIEMRTVSPEMRGTTDEELDARRAKAEDMIYATIRIKMDEMVEQRAKLLKDGRDPTDPEVRNLEGSIMRARELLIENGEIVEEIDPPIVQRAPTPAPKPAPTNK